jgi:hypothetical protein
LETLRSESAGRDGASGAATGPGCRRPPGPPGRAHDARAARPAAAAAPGGPAGGTQSRLSLGEHSRPGPTLT